MSRPREERPRVRGPYQHPQGWRVLVFDPRSEGGPTVRYFAREKEAQEFRELVESKFSLLEGTTVGEAIEAYEAHLIMKGNKPDSVKETARRMRAFFSDHKQILARLQPAKAKELYLEFANRVQTVDYHRNVLAEAKTFMRFCVKRGWVQLNPLESVEGFGRRKKGKPQLTGDEARRFHEWALYRISKGDEGAMGLEMALLMGLRNSEVFKRRVRDVDFGGTVLRIEDAKTEKGNRLVGVPLELQPHLRKLAEGREPTALLFQTPEGTMHTRSWLRSAAERLCKEAGVPYVCPHGLRGTNASLATQIGQVAQAVADHLGHESIKTTHGHYATGASVEAARQERLLRVISGGKR